MANALVVHRDRLPQSQLALRSAQYVRMSTEKQRYSIENQAAVIATYARLHGLTITKTYSDPAESGLLLKNRRGLIALLADVQSGNADFSHILVYDISRWGRFQDADESAHYEFICKKAGIKVAYCAEQFDNDGTMISSILKNLKRLMAAEYSRELSAKVSAGAARFAQLGFKIGGEPGYGLRRVLVDENSRPKAILKKGERKYLTTDHVRVRPGTDDEVTVVRSIFENFLRGKSETSIAGELNSKGVPTKSGRPWNRGLIGRILRDETYIGTLIYNRRSFKLREKHVYNPPALWIRSEGSVEPIIERNVFLQARKCFEERRVEISEKEMLSRLRRTLAKRGRLSPAIINETVGLPCVRTYLQHFGTLRNVYGLIGYTSTRDCEYLESRQGWADINAKLAENLGTGFAKAGCRVSFDPAVECLQIDGAASICFRVARWCVGRAETHAAHWAIRRKLHSPHGWIIALRLSEHNKSLLDYVLLPTSDRTGLLIRFSETARAARRIERFSSFETLARSLIRRVIAAKSRAAPARQERPKRPRPTRRSERPNRRGQR